MNTDGRHLSDLRLSVFICGQSMRLGRDARPPRSAFAKSPRAGRHFLRSREQSHRSQAHDRDHARRHRRLRLRWRRPARHLLHQRRGHPFARKVVAQILEPPLSQRRQLEVPRCHRSRPAWRAQATPWAPPSADFDNDGHPDLFVAGVNRNLLYRNRGDGTFEDVTAKAGIKSGEWAVAAGWFDYDRDGKLDLWVVHYAKWSHRRRPVLRRRRAAASASTAIRNISPASPTRSIAIAATAPSRT